MRIKETKVYLFDELSDAAKERARSWYREALAGDTFYAECVIDDAKEALKVLGYSNIKIMFSGFSSQGDGACFTAKFYASDYDGKGTNAVQAMLVDRSTDKELARCAAELGSILSACPELSASISHYGRKVHEMSTGFIIDCYGDALDDDSIDIDAIEERFKEVSRDLMRWIYKRLEADYEWNNADEQVDENIRSNGYEFDEDGNRA